eukprot:TRINITY_DN11631_c0_g1_i1.p1 TRINITY_DN11631_c0_g1~~TRINITY_DN11631_c0_g1_i1.p1  ORF type:complete len:459 (+),score=73.69 TRINITY_DN11631_c0_g1_i1:114-1490(+)
MSNSTATGPDDSDDGSRQGIAVGIIAGLTIFGIVLYIAYSRRKTPQQPPPQKPPQTQSPAQPQAPLSPEKANGYQPAAATVEMSPPARQHDNDDPELGMIVNRATSRMSDSLTLAGNNTMPTSSTSRSRFATTPRQGTELLQTPVTPHAPVEPGYDRSTSRFLDIGISMRRASNVGTPITPLTTSPAVAMARSSRGSVFGEMGRPRGVMSSSAPVPPSKFMRSPGTEPVLVDDTTRGQSSPGAGAAPLVGDLVLVTKGAHADTLQVACVAMAYPNGTFLIQFEDGDHRDHVPTHLLFRAGLYRIGQRVEFTCGIGEVRSAIVLAYEPMKCYTIQLESTARHLPEVRHGITEAELKLSPFSGSDIRRGKTFSVGDRVKKLHGGRRSGTITKVLAGGGGTERYGAVFGKSEEVLTAAELRADVATSANRVTLPSLASSPHRARRTPPRHRGNTAGNVINW